MKHTLKSRKEKHSTGFVIYDLLIDNEMTVKNGDRTEMIKTVHDSMKPNDTFEEQRKNGKVFNKNSYQEFREFFKKFYIDKIQF